MPDRKQGLTVDETLTVLKQVAHFHALSLAYKFEKPKQFENLRKLTEEALFSNDNANWYKKYYETLTKNAIKMVCKVLKIILFYMVVFLIMSSHKVSDVLPKDSKYLRIFEEFAETTTFFQRMVGMVSEESFLTAFCHGDCWANNFLYRYEDERKVLEVSIKDIVTILQNIRYVMCYVSLLTLRFV